MNKKAKPKKRAPKRNHQRELEKAADDLIDQLVAACRRAGIPREDATLYLHQAWDVAAGESGEEDDE